jgi:hypothetical protein
VDHAHLHVVPSQADLIRIVQSVSLEPLEFQAVEDLQATSALCRNGLPYLYVEQPVGEAYVATHPSLQSQLFRKAIASSIGSPGQYDWREHPYRDNVESTVEVLDSVLSNADHRACRVEALAR